MVVSCTGASGGDNPGGKKIMVVRKKGLDHAGLGHGEGLSSGARGRQEPSQGHYHPVTSPEGN